jgi:cytochrome c553
MTKRTQSKQIFKIRASILFGLLNALVLPLQAADVQAGKAKANSACAICHGSQGLSQMPNAPHLAGQPSIYIEEQMKHYRSGKRTHEVMGVIAKPLTDTDIENLAAWYSSIKIEVKAP